MAIEIAKIFCGDLADRNREKDINNESLFLLGNINTDNSLSSLVDCKIRSTCIARRASSRCVRAGVLAQHIC